MDKQPLLEVQDTDVGVMYGAARMPGRKILLGASRSFLLPFYYERSQLWRKKSRQNLGGRSTTNTPWSGNRTGPRRGELSEDEQRGWKDRVRRQRLSARTDDWLGRTVLPRMRRRIICWTAPEKKSFQRSKRHAHSDGAMQERWARSAPHAEHLRVGAAIVQMRRV